MSEGIPLERMGDCIVKAFLEQWLLPGRGLLLLAFRNQGWGKCYLNFKLGSPPTVAMSIDQAPLNRNGDYTEPQGPH